MKMIQIFSNRLSLLHLLFGTVLVVACTSRKEAPEPTVPSAQEITLRDSITLLKEEITVIEKLSSQDLLLMAYESQQHESYGNHTFNNTLPSARYGFSRSARLVRTTPLYATESDTANQLAQLPLNDEVKVLSQSNGWKAVAYKGKTGFIPKTAVCDHYIAYDDENIDFLIYSSKYTEYGAPQMVTMMAIDRAGNKVLGSLGVPFRVKEYWVSRGTTALKNAEYILTLNFTRSSCPGHEENYYYAYKEGVFTEVIHSFGMGEESYYSFNSVYLPVRFENNKVLHVVNADPQYALSWNSGSVGAALVPDSIEVPLDELVIIKSGQGEPTFDENGNPLVDAEGVEIMKDLGSAVHYFRWNGTTLELYKSTNPGFMAGMI